MNTRAPFDALTDIVNAQLPLQARARYWDTVFGALTDTVRRELPDAPDPEDAQARADELEGKRLCDVEEDDVGLTDGVWHEDQQFEGRG